MPAGKRLALAWRGRESEHIGGAQGAGCSPGKAA